VHGRKLRARPEKIEMTCLPSEQFGSVIRQLRESRGWSQERLAGAASINRSYMGEIERATAIPTLATAEKLAQALELALSDIILRCEEGSPAGLPTDGRSHTAMSSTG
jgi:XRE family transcriptional regulator, regulator of sulfur utilization